MTFAMAIRNGAAWQGRSGRPAVPRRPTRQALPGGLCGCSSQPGRTPTLTLQPAPFHYGKPQSSRTSAVASYVAGRTKVVGHPRPHPARHEATGRERPITSVAVRSSIRIRRSGFGVCSHRDAEAVTGHTPSESPSPTAAETRSQFPARNTGLSLRWDTPSHPPNLSPPRPAASETNTYNRSPEYRTGETRPCVSEAAHGSRRSKAAEIPDPHGVESQFESGGGGGSPIRSSVSINSSTRWSTTLRNSDRLTRKIGKLASPKGSADTRTASSWMRTSTSRWAICNLRTSSVTASIGSSMCESVRPESEQAELVEPNRC